jgi:hypothetical protein
MFDDVELHPDGTFVFDRIEFHEDGRSVLQWFDPKAAEQRLAAEQRPAPAPKKKTSAKVAGTPPRKPREVEPAKATPLKFLDESREKPRELKKSSVSLFGPKCTPTAVRVIFKGVEGPPLYVHLPQKKTSR